MGRSGLSPMAANLGCVGSDTKILQLVHVLMSSSNSSLERIRLKVSGGT